MHCQRDLRFGHENVELLGGNFYARMIGLEEFKLVQYADDLTLFVPNIECVKLILQLLDRFTICSGLKDNHTKTEVMWIGSCRQNTATPLGLKWSKSVKALGIVFTYNDTDQLQKNFYDKLKDIRTQIRLWNCRGLSLFGKVTSASQNAICILSSNNSRRIYKAIKHYYL